MVVPPTPLHTSRVLTEDKELWEDVKVKTAQFHDLTTWWQYSNTLPTTKHLHLTTGGTDQRPGHNASRLWPGEDQGPGYVQQPFALQETEEARAQGRRHRARQWWRGLQQSQGLKCFTVHSWFSSYSSLLYCTQTIKKCHLFWIVVSLLWHL